METIEYSDNSGKLNSLLLKKAAAYKRSMLRAVLQGMQKFTGDVIATQMSGRGPGDFGLNRVSGYLKGSTIATGTPEGAKMTVGAPYGKIHQFGGWIQQERSKIFRKSCNPYLWRAYIPKRLHIYEAFKYEGSIFIYKSINAALKVPS